MLVLDFVNSLDLRPRREELDAPAALAAWLAARGLVADGQRATEADLREAIELREAIRTLLAAHNDVPVDVEPASAVLDAAARRTGLGVRFTAGGVRLEPSATGIRAGLGSVLADVAARMADGSWDRLKACRADDCLWAFEDTAKNRSRAWCSMRTCGNRQKARVYRARHLPSNSSSR